MTLQNSHLHVPWRFLQSPPLDGAANMALDHALLGYARRTGATVLRVYGWSRPVLSLGRHQRARGLYDESLLGQHGIGLVRRPTGGRALLHHREVTYSVAAPARAGETVAGFAQRVNTLLLSALSRLGVPAQLADPPRTGGSRDRPCFAEPAAGELVVEGRKLVGSAQWREEGAVLQHGSILLEDDQALIAGLMTTPPSFLPPAPATLHALLGRLPRPDEVARALRSAVSDAEGAPVKTLEGSPADDDLRALQQLYSDPRWTWRR